VKLAIKFDYLGEACTDEDTCTVHISMNRTVEGTADATWTGGAVLPSGKTCAEWWRVQN